MINAQDYFSWLARYLSDSLEEIDTTHEYEIKAQTGDYVYQSKQGKIRRKEKVHITGTLLSRPDDLVPIEGYELQTATSLLTLVVPNPFLQEVFGCVSDLVKNKNGKVGSYTSSTGTTYDSQFSFTQPTVVNLDQKQGAGTSAEIRLFITTVVFKDAVIGNQVHLSIVWTETVNGVTVTKKERLEVLQGAIQAIKSYESDNVSRWEFVKNVPASQALTITEKVAYRKTAKLMEMVNDMFTGALDKTYTIEYSDGAAVPNNAPKTFETTVGQNTLSFAPGEIAAIDLVLYRR